MARVLCTIFCRQTLENRDWKRGHEAMSQQILQVDQAMLETTLDRMVRKSVEETLNAMLDAEADEITGAARYERSGDRKAYRPLRARPDRQGRQNEPESAETQGRGVRVGRDRTIPSA